MGMRTCLHEVLEIERGLSACNESPLNHILSVSYITELKIKLLASFRFAIELETFLCIALYTPYNNLIKIDMISILDMKKFRLMWLSDLPHDLLNNK